MGVSVVTSRAIDAPSAAPYERTTDPVVVEEAHGVCGGALFLGSAIVDNAERCGDQMSSPTHSTVRVRYVQARYAETVRVGEVVSIHGVRPYDALGHVRATCFTDQARRALRNLETVLEVFGVDLGCVKVLSVHLTELQDGERLSAIWSDLSPEPLPVTITTGVGRATDCAAIELQAIAATPCYSNR